MTRTPSPFSRALTATFEDVPEEHGGSSVFTFKLRFSDEPEVGYRTLRDQAIAATGGTVKRARRLARGRNDRWEVHVKPTGGDPVTVTLSAPAACGMSGAVCTADGRKLANAPTATIAGAPGLSVADARVSEGPGAQLGFRITLSRAVSWRVWVDVATSDDSAKAGEDYAWVDQGVYFPSGTTSKTVRVLVFDDEVDEGSETLTFTLSNPRGAYIADGEATGTITNDDAMPQAWLARFGRTVADQVLDAVEDRMRGVRSPGAALSFAGHSVGGAVDREALEEREAERHLETLSEWLRGEAAEDRAGLESRELTAQELLAGSSFAWTQGSAEAGFGALWGRGAVTRFDGREGEVTLDGTVESALVGADWTRGGTSAGVALAHSRGAGGYRDVRRGHPWQAREAPSGTSRHLPNVGGA